MVLALSCHDFTHTPVVRSILSCARSTQRRGPKSSPGRDCRKTSDCAAMIVDAHNDVLLELAHRPRRGAVARARLRRGEERLFERYWLPRLEAGGVGVQVCPLYGACAPGDGWRGRALAQEAELGRAVEANAERVCLVRAREELDDPRLRLVLSMEGVEPLEGDPGAFEEWYERGVRSAGLTWNHANEFAGGIETPDARADRTRDARSCAASASWASSWTSRTRPSRPGGTCSRRGCRSRSRTRAAARCAITRATSPTGSCRRSRSAEAWSG